MDKTNATGQIIGAFPDLDRARMAMDDLKSAGFDKGDLRLIENRCGGGASREAGLSRERQGFFSRLFGVGDENLPTYNQAYTDIGQNDRFSESDRFFTQACDAGMNLVVVQAVDGRAQEAQAILRRDGAEIDERAGGWLHERTQDFKRMILHAEELVPHKERVETGEVTIRKEVVTENKTFEVPVSHEEVVIERHKVAPGSVAADEAGRISANELRPGEEMRIPVSAEHVEVERRTVPVEEVDIGKRVVQESEKVSGDVKREQVRIEKEGQPKVRERVEEEHHAPA